MSSTAATSPAPRVGIDLGTTYSSIAVLDRHGRPESVANAAGEFATPSAVLFEADGSAVVGREAARTAVASPDRVVTHAKRFLHDAGKKWFVGGRAVTPVEVSSLVLKDLLDAAAAKHGAIREAVVTVPVQFGAAERARTVEAARAAGLEEVTLIDEPVAAALCHVLAGPDADEGGLWFSELADATTVLVFDLGGGTLDLALVSYGPDGVSVRAAGGDPRLGGADFTDALADALAGQFARTHPSLKTPDPRDDPAANQALQNEVEAAKRALSVRPHTPVTLHHAGAKKTYKVDRDQFDRLTAGLVGRARDEVVSLIRGHSRGWGEVDAVLLTGGSTRIPAVRAMLKDLAGTTPSTELSPDQSVAHGACLYAGLLARDEAFARSFLGRQGLLGSRKDTGEWRDRLATALPGNVTGRGLGILVRDDDTGERVPHYLIPPNAKIPAEATQTFGLVRAGQRRVRLRVVQAGPTSDAPPAELGECVVAPLPPGLPENAPVAVTLALDASGLVHTTAVEKTGGTTAEAKLVPPDADAPTAPPAAEPPGDDPAESSDPTVSFGPKLAGSADLADAPTDATHRDTAADAAAADDSGDLTNMTSITSKTKSTRAENAASPAPPAPPRTGTEAEEGESEFWSMVAPADPPRKPKRRRRARAR